MSKPEQQPNPWKQTIRDEWSFVYEMVGLLPRTDPLVLDDGKHWSFDCPSRAYAYRCPYCVEWR